MTTLETGSGGSTIVFAAAGCRHTAISPARDEHERVRAWCAARGIATEHVTFLAEPSHVALQRMWEPAPLDLVLVDGAHGFPHPALDWFLTAPHLRVGGHVLIDDAFLPSVSEVVRYLDASPAWQMVATPGYRTVVFRKDAEGIPFDWVGSRFDRRPRFGYLPLRRRPFAYARTFLIDRSAIGRRILGALRRR
jgi:predicted O-methyltransferase YrrM